jgi:hypothetical protein
MVIPIHRVSFSWLFSKEIMRFHGKELTLNVLYVRITAEFCKTVKH